MMLGLTGIVCLVFLGLACGEAFGWKRVLAYWDETLLPLDRFLLVIFLVCSGANVVRAVKAISAQVDTTSPESAIVETSRWAYLSNHVYPALDASPYTPAAYGPLFYLGLAAIGKGFGGDTWRIRLLLRWIALATYLLAGFLAGLLARRAGATRNAAMLASAISWAAPFALFWNVSARPDFPALMLSLAGVCVISRCDRPKFSDAALAGVLCAGAFLLKQSFIAAPLAVMLLLVLRRFYRQFAIFAAAGLLSALSVIGYLMLRGEPVLRETLLIAHSPVQVKSGIAMLYYFASAGLTVVVLAGGYAGLLSSLGFERWRLNLLACYFLFASAVTVLTLLTVGGSINYLYETWSVAAILLVCALPSSQVLWRQASRPLIAGAAAVMILLGGQSLLTIRRYRGLPFYRFDRLQNLHVLSTDSSLAAHGRDPELLDPFLTTILEQRGLWSPAGVINEISRQKFDVAFVGEINGDVYSYRGQPYFSAAIMASLQNSYRPLCRASWMTVMVPRERQSRFSLSDASHTLGQRCDLVPDGIPQAR